MNKIILIGGTPRSGKTTLAQKIAKELNTTWVSTDAFDDIAKKYVPESEQKRLFPKTALRQKADGGNDQMYATFSTKEIVAAYIQQARTIHPAIESFILCANTEGWDYVIEGYHLTPTLIAKLQSKYSNIKSIVLVCLRGEEAVERSKQSDTKQDWVRDRTNTEESFRKIADMVSLFSKELIEEAKTLDVKVMDVSVDFQSKFNEALIHLKQ